MHLSYLFIIYLHNLSSIIMYLSIYIIYIYIIYHLSIFYLSIYPSIKESKPYSSATLPSTYTVLVLSQLEIRTQVYSGVWPASNTHENK